MFQLGAPGLPGPLPPRRPWGTLLTLPGLAQTSQPPSRVPRLPISVSRGSAMANAISPGNSCGWKQTSGFPKSTCLSYESRKSHPAGWEDGHSLCPSDVTLSLPLSPTPPNTSLVRLLLVVGLCPPGCPRAGPRGPRPYSSTPHSNVGA